MGLEAGTNISQLDLTWPTAGDPRSQGDDHLRLIKAVLKSTFPGVGGVGFNTPILAKESELNALPALLASRVGFLVNKSATQGGFTDTYALVTWQTEVLDNANGFATNKYTIPAGQAGLWAFFTGIINNAVSSAWQVAIRKNGANATATYQFGTVESFASPQTFFIDQAADGDSYDVVARITSGGGNIITTGVGTQFAGIRLL